MIDAVQTAVKIIKAREWKNGYLITFVEKWIEKGIPDWSLTDVPEKKRKDFIVEKVNE